jgi:hypothetical protein
VSEFGLFIGWGAPHAGRELAAGKVFEEAVAYWQGLKASGEIESFEYVQLNAHGGDLGGFALLRGDPEKLGRLRMTPEFLRLIMRMEVLCEHVGVVDAAIGEGARQIMGAWNDAVADLL